MKKLLYHLFYALLLLVVDIGGVLSLIYTILNISNTDNLSDSILFILCFAVFIIFVSFQIYAVLRSQKNEGVFLKGLLYGKEDILSTSTLGFVTVLIGLGIFMIVYASLLFFDKDLPFSSFPKSLDLLTISLGGLLVVNGIFIDIYPKIKYLDK